VRIVVESAHSAGRHVEQVRVTAGAVGHAARQRTRAIDERDAQIVALRPVHEVYRGERAAEAAADDRNSPRHRPPRRPSANTTAKDGAQRIVAAAREQFGEPDILVVNSPGPVPDRASNRWRGFENCSDDDFLEVYRCFVMSTVYLVREVLPMMRERRFGRL